MRRLLPFLLLLIAACAADSDAPLPGARKVPMSALEEKIESLAATIEGTVGVGVLHAETGARISFNGAERFPMASVYKLPIAIKVMRDVEQGRLRLDSVVTVTPAEAGPYHSPVMDASGDASVSVTLDSLLALMLGLSDNTASDVLLRLTWGPEAVTAYLHEEGFDALRVDRSEREMALAVFIKGSAQPDSLRERERVVAEIGRAVFDHFTPQH